MENEIKADVNTVETEIKKKHSGLGIASFTISIIAAILIFLEFVVAGVMEVSSPGGVDEESAAAILLGLAIIMTMGALLLSGALGIAGLFQSNRKKVFSILGIIFSAIPFGITLILMIIGMSLE